MTYYRYRFSFGYGLTPVIKNLILAMGAVFVLQMLVDRWIVVYFGLVPIFVWTRYFLWQLVTYIFLHGGLSHLLFNLLGLWMFGGELESYWGSGKFLRYFLFCGIGAAVCTVIFSPLQFVPIVGASGAIYGILLAFGWLFPHRPILIYFLFPIPAKYFVVLFGLIEFFSSLGGTGGGVAHLTHLGGLLFGLIYMGYPSIYRGVRRHYYRWKWSRRGPDKRDYYH